MRPAEHYAAAEELISRAAHLDGNLDGNLDGSLAGQLLIARAQVHATLAQCPDWYGDPDYADDHDSGYVTARPVETRIPTGEHL